MRLRCYSFQNHRFPRLKWKDVESLMNKKQFQTFLWSSHAMFRYSSKRSKSPYYRDLFIFIFSVPLYIIAKLWSQASYPEWSKGCIQWCSLSHKKERNYVVCRKKDEMVEIIILNELNKSHKSKYNELSVKCKSQKMSRK